ncbi:hypothetical protein Alches_18620 [Alicyclobacillus hesperidum subsp. aegles]|uniref:hypothetical protein n=1 Tax=Alicyclobacillus hesperidum TaxID=89784 RepID=UPI00222A0A56|nr:hypothetical protein [Alicyclobacillus hesperidum]GLG01821.1 hypothetical protein Alches_18620 [Alicyclobacillus hesperidum subsp. aegles]
MTTYVVDKVRTRQAVQAYFAVYRRFVQLLNAGTVPREELPPVPGYENAADPDSIHAPGFRPGSPVAVIDGKLRYMAWFVKDVNRVVRGLPRYQEVIIRTQFMGREQLSNEETYEALLRADSRWCYGMRHFESQRSEAIMTLADLLGLTLYLENSQ